ncbi:uncharacterized protein LOC130589875 [Beta vulgaris subsp. vulgaris]|uniref:uncharacterized protein LOC130589875 n=1 Tax=Beta vulgaris subsp. vulgaris TaxID=3555 RepID=UPI0025472576|nr:uncharacterized protein LOC130589875 [Beta vulgaris subsp. vulgaris]
MAANDNYHPNGRNRAKKGGKYDVDALTTLTNTVQALSHKKELQDHPLKEPSKRTVKETVQTEKVVENEIVEEEKKEPTPTPIRPYTPPVPFPQRLARAKLEKKYGKFLDILKKLHINIPFLEAISEMPSYAKFLKTYSQTSGRSRKMQLFHLQQNALCDLGASVSLMPLSICKKLQWVNQNHTYFLQLADRTVKYPLGILEDVPLRVGKFFIPCDFVVMEMEEDAQVPIILGRPFLATAGAIIDMKNGKITFEVGTEKMEYNLTNSMEAPSMGETIYRVDALDEAIEVKAASLHL